MRRLVDHRLVAYDGIKDKLRERTMDLVKKLEKQLGDLFKGLPALSPSAKESIAKVWPWLALIFGVLQLVVALGLWRVVSRTSAVVDYVNDYYQAVTGQSLGLSSFDKTLIYLGILTLLVDAVILLMAFPKLQKRLKAGWDLIFLASLLNVVYAVLSIFLNGQGIGSFLGSLIGSAIGFYLLFQVREKFGGTPVHPAPTSPTPPATPPAE